MKIKFNLKLYQFEYLEEGMIVETCLIKAK